MIELLQTSLPLWTATAVVIGLLVGSFLNVVIHRLPRMLQQGWQRECRLLLELPDQPSESKPESLVFPGSRCPACRADIRWYDNIPVLSFLRLKGRCRQCSTKIGWRYPLVEAITALLTGVVAWQLGFGLFGAAAIALTWALVALSTIDFDHQLLPDNITLPALWAGLLLSVLGGPVSPADAVIGAAVGYLSLWLVFHGFRLITGKEGMGYGDFKLLAVFGAWLGWQALPLIILLSSVVGALVGGGLIASGALRRDQPMPFGPYIAAAGWIAMLWGDAIIQGYFSFAGL
ncbi:MAG: prepilin peptidase [Xanthomonadales bacterium]|nr:A24 family peptidase [Abyssibacter sp.]MBB86183.1 prepilin peptidase [Xanthomonadales bacterium]